MTSTSIRHLTSSLLLMAGAGVATSCSGPAETPVSPSFAKGGAKPTSGPSVTTADPPYGHEGDVTKQVTITGSGFVAGAVASWERGGVTDLDIVVSSTQFVSSTQLIATISIAPTAKLDFYDVAVTNTDRKKGIGFALFEVTQAVAISGTEIAYGANSPGQITGRVGVPGAFAFSAPAGPVVTLGGAGRGYDISEDGLTVVGGNTINASNAQAYVFTLSGGVWTKTFLPKDPASCIVRALAVASDPTTGAATWVGGVENGGCYSGSNYHRQPRVWSNPGTGWIKSVLPGGTNTDDALMDITAAGVAAGTASNQAAIWTPSGAGTWTLALIGPPGSSLNGINNDGTLAVGGITSGNSTAAAYWTRSGSTWSGPFALPGGCSSAVDVDEGGRIVTNDCPNGNRRTPAVIVSPYGAGNVTFLGGLGDSRNASTAQGISAANGWIVGQSNLKSSSTGVYWKI
jgi:hypothetical protein